MGYIEKSLAGSEQLIYKAHFHWLYRASAWVVLLACAGGAFYIHQETSTGASDGWLLPGAVMVAGIFVFLAIMVPIWSQEIGVTTQRLIHRRGLVSRSTEELQLRAVEEVNLEQSILGRILGYGRVTVSGTGEEDMRLPALAEPVVLQQMIQEAISMRSAHAA